jgi:hypothetical protein
MEQMATEFRVNGQAVSSDAPTATPLLWVIREQLKLTGTKFGCGAGLCGAYALIQRHSDSEAICGKTPTLRCDSLRAVMTAPDSLPTKAKALRALLLAERARHAEELTAARNEVERLVAIIKELQRHRFGRRSEQLDPDQLALALEDLEQALAAAEAAAEKNGEASATPAVTRKRQINRGALPRRRDFIKVIGGAAVAWPLSRRPLPTNVCKNVPSATATAERRRTPSLRNSAAT